MSPTPVPTGPLTEPDGGDVDRGPSLMALVITQCVVAAIFVAMRMYSRFMIRGLGWDDWLMVVTMILFVCTTSILVQLALEGGCRHLYYLTAEEKYSSLKFNWIVQPFAIMSFATSKASVGLGLMRIIGDGGAERRVIFLWALISLSALINTVGAIMVFAQCSPPYALWTPGMEDKCWHPSVQMNYEVFVGSWNALCDFSLAILPITIVFPLNMSIKKRVGVCILLGLGFFACISACVKTSMLSALGERSDLTWETFDLWAWTASETFLLIVCGSIPPIRPLYNRMLGRDKDEYGNTNREYRDKSPRHSARGQQEAYSGGPSRRSVQKRRPSKSESSSGIVVRDLEQRDEEHGQDIEMADVDDFCHAKSVYNDTGSEFGDGFVQDGVVVAARQMSWSQPSR